MTSLVVGQRPCPGLHSRRANRCRAVSPLAESYPIFRSLLPKAGTEKAESAEQPEQQPSTGLGALSKLLPLAQPTSIDPLAEALANEGADTAPPAIGVAGGGIFYFWEVGVLKYLSENFDLDRAQLVGVSAGALCSVLTACGVSPDRSVREAFRLSTENDIWNRPGGLAGIWAGLIRQWLDELLPADADVRCAGRVRLIATEVPTLRLRYLDEFESREDLIDACMASVHIPFFLDGNASFTYKGKRYVDGSLWDFLSGSNSQMLTCNGEACVVDYFMDDQLQYSRLDFIKLSSYEEVKALVRSGYEYARRTDAAGGYEEKLGSLRKGVIRRVLEYPVYALNKVNAVA